MRSWGGQDQDAVPPLDRAEARLLVAIGPIRRLLAGHFCDDLELRSLSIGLEADGVEATITDDQHREDVLLATRGTVAGVRTRLSSTGTGPVQHLRHGNDADLVDVRHLSEWKMRSPKRPQKWTEKEVDQLTEISATDRAYAKDMAERPERGRGLLAPKAIAPDVLQVRL